MNRVILILFLSLTCTYGASQTIVVGVHPGLTYPDFEKRNGKNRGIIPTLFDTFAKAKGHKVIYKI